MIPHARNPDLPAPAATGAGEPASPRATSSLRAGWQRLGTSLWGDALGLACVIFIFLIFYFVSA